MPYIEGELTSNRADLEAMAFEFIQSVMPEWSAVPGSLITILVQAVALMAETLAVDATEMLPEAFRYFGQSILGIPLSDGAPARATTVWTLADTDGHTIPADTFITIDGKGFQVISDVTVAPGSSSADAVEVEAVEDGTAYNGLFLNAAPADSLDWVTGITVPSPTAGGEDAMSDEDYQDDLSERLLLLADRLILPSDFEIAAMQVPGVHRVVALDGYNPGTNEVQTLTLANATGGTFTMTFSGQTTTALAFNATAAQVQAALEALSNINPHDVRVSGGPLMTGPVTIEFTGQFAATNAATITTTSSLTGTSPTATITTTTASVASATSQERMIALAAIDDTGAPITPAIKSALATFLDAKREVNFVVNVFDPSYAPVNVSFTVHPYADFDPASVIVAATQALTDYLNPLTWGTPTSGETGGWLNSTKVRLFEVVQVLANVEGVDYVGSVTINGSAADLTITGAATLPLAGTIIGSYV